MALDLLRLSLLGGILGLDGTSAGQFMVSRPVIAGTIAGWLVGEPAAGLAAGAILELYLLVSFPTGGARFPEGATATIVAAGTFMALQGPGALPLAVALGLFWGHLGGVTVTLLRRLNTRLVPEPGDAVESGRVGRVLAAAVAMDFGRGVLVTASGLAVGVGILAPLAVFWPLDDAGSRALLLVGGAVSLGILLNDLGGARARGAWFAAGVLAGLAGLVLL